jgi:L-alanine-DL-glutamate epimerase-like enolase superfamily enzyme
MRIAGATVHPYALPLVRPWVASRATLTERRGRLLAVTGEDGLTGWGDCAPLPSSGDAGHARVFQALDEAARGLTGRDTAEAPPSAVPEVRWAVETALCDLEARRAGVPLWRFLRASFPVIARSAATKQSRADTSFPSPGLLRPRPRGYQRRAGAAGRGVRRAG